MPYVDEEARSRLKHSCPPMSPGELNYCITRLVDSYVSRLGLSYANINAAIGALECAKLELYRRIATPYEDRKLAQNGEVYAAARVEAASEPLDHSETTVERGSAVTVPGL